MGLWYQSLERDKTIRIKWNSETAADGRMEQFLFIILNHSVFYFSLLNFLSVSSLISFSGYRNSGIKNSHSKINYYAYTYIHRYIYHRTHMFETNNDEPKTNIIQIKDMEIVIKSETILININKQ